MTPRPFEVTWTPTAQRDLSRLPEKIATAVVEFTYGSLADNPRRIGRELRLDLVGLHSARRGDFRVIYRAAGDPHRIDIVAVGHRGDVYRPRE